MPPTVPAPAGPVRKKPGPIVACVAGPGKRILDLLRSVGEGETRWIDRVDEGRAVVEQRAVEQVERQVDDDGAGRCRAEAREREHDGAGCRAQCMNHDRASLDET
jgi:hypothetical protein